MRLASRAPVRFQGSITASSMEPLSSRSSVADNMGGHRNPWRLRSGTIAFPALLIPKYVKFGERNTAVWQALFDMILAGLCAYFEREIFVKFYRAKSVALWLKTLKETFFAANHQNNGFCTADARTFLPLRT
ncbi:hypothetical protein OPV22_011269 [Ensete ventricosum]|uniref:Uncharacterized protein n=1 Tax=Ensete ventricosum TaxID=4639 RepID=A0AAV8RN09_ENSVE|nr:hypothetical protein OPV22_011269 [Ensete ventricosum]